MKEGEKTELIAHNGSVVRVDSSDKECLKFSGFKYQEIIIKNGKIAIVMGIGHNPFSLQRELWIMQLGDLGITSSDPKKWSKATPEEIIEFFKKGRRQEINLIEYVEASYAQVAID